MRPIRDMMAQKADLVKTFNEAKIDPKKKSEVDLVVKTIMLHKDLYVKTEELTTVPWFVVAIIHNMECSLNFKLGLHCGTAWNKVTKQVPKGRGPFKSWIEASVDSLHISNLDTVGVWKLEDILYNILKFNGFGCYIGSGINSTPPYRSAYLWSFTTAYIKGKYTGDGVWNPNAVSEQVGAAAILKDMCDQGLVKL